MFEFIYPENGKFFQTITDMIGKILFPEEISEAEYLAAKEGERDDG